MFPFSTRSSDGQLFGSCGKRSTNLITSLLPMVVFFQSPNLALSLPMWPFQSPPIMISSSILSFVKVARSSKKILLFFLSLCTGAYTAPKPWCKRFLLRGSRVVVAVDLSSDASFAVCRNLSALSLLRSRHFRRQKKANLFSTESKQILQCKPPGIRPLREVPFVEVKVRFR
eukprot:TRINITY_DN24338_c0_g2_i1.p1 TRINITY_DN24338_c0_g2~~TRINITY_DN24338_c0_g2_i1.p1  ORF type:complete len:172 (-),score=6.71 TRINITY_DN24338_c0_g2_i1:148-663(-)